MKAPKTLFLALAALAAACGGDFSTQPGKERLVVEIIKPMGPDPTGSRTSPNALQIGVPFPFRFTVKALLPDGTQDASFTRYVRISAKPGAVGPLTGPDTDGRNVLLRAGVSQPVDIQITNAFGTTYIVADDLGYVPADPLRKNPDGSPNPPQCANGKDDNDNGLIDFPADPGCAYANDDDENGGTYDTGISQPIYFSLPRIADARGLNCGGAVGCTGGGQTPYPKEQLLLDTGWHEAPTMKHPQGPGFDFDTVVTRVSASGFFVQDLADGQRGPQFTGFNALFAYNFNAPPKMRVCDRVKSLAGTADEFYGFTQLSYPTWELEPWDPSKRACLVPEPTTLRPGDLKDTTTLQRLTAALVRVETNGTTAKIAANIGPGDTPLVPNDGKNCGPPPSGMPARANCYIATPDASNCDFNKNGKINFDIGNPEGICSNDCDDLTINPAGCAEYSNFKARSEFKLLVTDENMQVATIQANAAAAAGLDVSVSKGQKVRAFTGSLTFFSGGSQYTIEARCSDDVIMDLTATPFDAGKACVLPRTFLELNPQ
jgi:hypothetical protein